MTENQIKTLRENNERSKELTREALADALIQLMKKKEYRSISVTELASKAGVSRAAFYRNFDSIDDVLNDKITSVALKISRAVGPDLRENWTEVFKIIEENKEAVRSFILSGQEHKILDYLNDELPVEPERRMLQAVWNAIMYNLIIQWIITGKPEAPEDMADLSYEYTKFIQPL